MRVALLTYNARAGNAIGNQVAEKLAFFLDRGADVRVFLEDERALHPAIRRYARTFRVHEPRGECWRFLASSDLVLVEYSQDYALLRLLPLLAGGKSRILFDYHGVTPPELWEGHNREALENGVRQRGLIWCADRALVHSRFTGRELQPTGFPSGQLHQLGYPLDTSRFTPGRPAFHLREQLHLTAASLLLYVGRLAVNKRVPLLVEALARLRDLEPAVHLAVLGDSSDLYEMEARRCKELAGTLGVADRLHMRGQVTEDALLDAYRSADVFVMPSQHEGFCIPAIEAMACGLPTVAARAGALPETLGSAGLTFTPEDVDDLARQVRRVLETSKRVVAVRSGGVSENVQRPTSNIQRPTIEDRRLPLDVGRWTLDVGRLAASASRKPPPKPGRLAIVSFRYGTGFVGGAETSLKTIARALHEAGHDVEVFSTCTQSESHWTNKLPEGASRDAGIVVHRFRLDPHDAERHGEAFRAILEGDGTVSEAVQREYLAHSIHSSRLIETLRRRQDEFDAIIVGPYLFGLTLDIVRALPEKTLLLPCFHDEPLAHLPIWRNSYERVAGVLYHSPEEQRFAEIELGLNHPGATCIGSLVAKDSQGEAEEGRKCVGTGRRYVVYCGRYSRQKNLPLLLDFARRYAEQHPERFTFVFLGQGDVAIPPEDWACDLGFVEEIRKRHVLAGAEALIQLSPYESLSLTALEAWAEGTPVIAHRQCAVLVGQIERAQGGRAVEAYASFAAVLDDLWENPQGWRQLGKQGQEYVRSHYGSRERFLARLQQALAHSELPLAEQIRRQGWERAQAFDRLRWRELFGQVIEDVLDAPPRPYRELVEVRPRVPVRSVAGGSGQVWIPARVVNRGSHALAHEGPARVILRCQLRDEGGQPCELPAETPLPRLLVPGRALSVTVRVPVPAAPGVYRVRFLAAYAEAGRPLSQAEDSGEASSELRLEVGSAGAPANHGCCALLLETVQAALGEAEQRHGLPDNYLDVTEGWFAAWKRRIKKKLLGNFKRAYVDVLSRQQSAFNRHILAALRELAEVCSLLDHATSRRAASVEPTINQSPATVNADEVARLLRRLEESERRCAVLEERLARLESATPVV